MLTRASSTLVLEDLTKQDMDGIKKVSGHLSSMTCRILAQTESTLQPCSQWCVGLSLPRKTLLYIVREVSSFLNKWFLLQDTLFRKEILKDILTSGLLWKATIGGHPWPGPKICQHWPRSLRDCCRWQYFGWFSVVLKSPRLRRIGRCQAGVQQFWESVTSGVSLPNFHEASATSHLWKTLY